MRRGPAPSGSAAGNGVNPRAGAVGDNGSDWDKPLGVYLASYHSARNLHVNEESDGYDWTGVDQDWERFTSDTHHEEHWTSGVGGHGQQQDLWQEDIKYQYQPYQHNPSDQVTHCQIDYQWGKSDYPDQPGTATATGDCNGQVPAATFTCRQPEVTTEHCGVEFELDTFYASPYVSQSDGLTHSDHRHTGYDRTADGYMKVRTGGKQIPGQQSLWEFGGSAVKILDKTVLTPTYIHALPSSGIDPTKIYVGEKHFGSDGLLWMTLPDGADLPFTPTIQGEDFYSFSIGGSKYKPYIQANTVRLLVCH